MGVPKLYSLSFLMSLWSLVLFTTFVLLPKFKVTPPEGALRDDAVGRTHAHGDRTSSLSTSKPKAKARSQSHEAAAFAISNGPQPTVQLENQICRGSPLQEVKKTKMSDIELAGQEKSGSGKIMNDTPTSESENVRGDSSGDRHMQSIVTKLSTDTTVHLSLGQFVLSPTYLVYLFWYTVLYVRIHMFVVAFNAWVTGIVQGDRAKGKMGTVV